MRLFCFLIWCVICFPNIAHAASLPQFPPAPIDNIMKHQTESFIKLLEYKKNIINSYTMQPSQLNTLLESEYAEINRETERMHKIKKNWRSLPYAYRYANYKLNEQISDEITQSRKKFINRKKRFNDLIGSARENKPIYIIESTDPLFFYATIRANPNNKTTSRLRMTFSSHGIHYLSVFDSEYNHLFTYNRQHVDMLQQRRIISPTKTKNKRVNDAFQKLFDDYLVDMKRIGAGLDINNKALLAKLNDMCDETRSE